MNNKQKAHLRHSIAGTILAFHSMLPCASAAPVQSYSFSDGTTITGDFTNPSSTQITVSNDVYRPEVNGDYSFLYFLTSIHNPNTVQYAYSDATLDLVSIIVDITTSVPVPFAYGFDTYIYDYHTNTTEIATTLDLLSAVNGAVPEPASIALLAAGLLGMGAARKKGAQA